MQLKTFFEKINKIDKNVNQSHQGKKGGVGRAHINMVRNEKGEVAMDTTEIRRIIGDYYKQRWASQAAQWYKSA